RRYVLLAVLALIRKRIRIDSLVELVCPEFLSGFRIERAEPPITCGADEHKPSGCHDRAGAAGSAGVLLANRERFVQAKRRLPCNLTAVCIYRPEPAPRRLLARRVSDGAARRILDR